MRFKDFIGKQNQSFRPQANACIRFLTYLFVVAEPMCDVKYQKLGCYRDTTKKPRLLEKLILTDRDPKSPVFSNVRVNWGNWDSYLPSLACRCAKKAAEYQYTYFGLQHYGRYGTLYNCVHLLTLTFLQILKLHEQQVLKKVFFLSFTSVVILLTKVVSSFRFKLSIAYPGCWVRDAFVRGFRFCLSLY